MDVYALFTDGTAEKIIIDSIAKKESEKGLIIRTTISSQNLKESAISSVKNTLILLDKHYSNLPEDIAICIFGFSNKVLGNSADLAFALSFVGHLLESGYLRMQNPIPYKIAATGVIDERLNIRSIKGIKEKILAAIEAEAKVIFFPEENVKEFEEIIDSDNEFSNLIGSIKTVPVKSLEEALIQLGVINTEVTNDKEKPFSKGIVIAPLVLSVVLTAAIFIMGKTFSNKNSHEAGNFLPIVTSTHMAGVSPASPIPSTTAFTLPKAQPTPAMTASTQPTSTPQPVTQSPQESSSKPGATDTLQSTAPKIASTPTPQKSTVTEAPKVINTEGNSAANLMNYGFTSIQGDWIYYTNNLDVGLYRMKQDGSEKTLINKDFAAYINVLGEYLYYINKNNNSLYKFRTDGKVNTDGSNPRRLNNDDIKTIFVIENWIYYIGLSDNRIYKIDKSGFDRTPLFNYFFAEAESYGTGFECQNLNIYNNFIYFYMEFKDGSEKNGIYKIAADDSDSICLYNGRCSYLTVDNGNIFFISSTDNCLYKMDLGGNNRRKLTGDGIKAFNAASDWIYYSNNTGLYKIHTDGDFNTKINNDVTGKINVAGDWIFYLNASDGNRMYKVRTNGKDRQRVD